MKITFKTGGLLAEMLPADAVDDAMGLELPDGSTPIDVMAHFDLPEDDFYLVILNDEVIPKSRREMTVLRDGDELGIFPPLKGG